MACTSAVTYRDHKITHVSTSEKKYFSQKVESAAWSINQISAPALPPNLRYMMVKSALLWNQARFLNVYTEFRVNTHSIPTPRLPGAGLAAIVPSILNQNVLSVFHFLTRIWCIKTTLLAHIQAQLKSNQHWSWRNDGPDCGDLARWQPWVLLLQQNNGDTAKRRQRRPDD